MDDRPSALDRRQHLILAYLRNNNGLLTLFGNLESGNVHKAQLVLREAGIAFRRVDTAQSRGEPRSKEFLAINPIGKVPAVLFDNGDVLSESGAILYFFGRDTPLWPTSLREQSEVLRWMFFEQYNHEPSLAVIRFLKQHTTARETAQRVKALEPKAREALTIMEQRLCACEWVACDTCSIADYALYPYTRTMEASGFDRADYPGIDRWLDRLEDRPGFLAMGTEGGHESMSFSEYVSTVR